MTERRAISPTVRNGPSPRGARLIVRFTLLFVTVGAVPNAAPGATPAATPAAGPSPTVDAELATKREAVRKDLEQARRERDAAAPEDREHLGRVVELLRTLDLLYGRHVIAAQELAEREADRAEVEREREAFHERGLPTPGPYSLQRLDEAHDQLAAERARQRDADAAARLAEVTLEQSREIAEKNERSRREAKEALETNADPAAAPALERALRLRKLESVAAGEQVRLSEIELKRQQLEVAIAKLRARLLQEKIARLAADVRFTREELDKRLKKLDRREAELQEALQKAQKELAAAEQSWASARRKAERTTEDEASEAKLAAKQRALQTRQLAVVVLGERLQRLAALKEAWNRRFRLVSEEMRRSELSGWEDETERALDELGRHFQRNGTRLAELQAQRRRLLEQLEAAGSSEAMKRWLREELHQLEEQSLLYDDSLASVDQSYAVHGRLLGELQTRLGSLALRERAQSAWDSAVAVWRYEIFAIDDRPVTVGKIVAGLLLFSLGFLVAGFASRQLGQRVFPRLGVEAGVAAALESISYYLFLLLLGLLALNVINVPLTAFTLLGGAAAIGIGFGSQNIINNFISGLILFAERPIRVGDMVEIDGTYGGIERIGPRSTRVRTFSGYHIIVPNSSFLEKNVVNWTLSDDQVRTHVAVGVVYGSPLHDVTRLIGKAVDEHGKILKKPEPVILFTDFGDSALVFEVHFWIRMRRQMERRIIESDIRHRIDQLFREAGIVIAFPQTDVHLDTTKPIEVRWKTEPPETGGGPPSG